MKPKPPEYPCWFGMPIAWCGIITNLLFPWSTQQGRIHRFAKEGGWILVGQIASVLGALVLVRVLTGYLDPDEYGDLALGLTIATLVNQVAMGGIIAGIGRFYSIAAEKGDLGGYLQASKRLLTYATLVVILMAIFMISGLMAVGQDRWIGLGIAVLVFSILSSYNSALNSIQNAARQRAVVALHSGMDAWLKIGLAIGMMLWLGSVGTTAVIGYALSALILTGSQFVFLKRLIQRQSVSRDRKSNENWQGQIWLFSWPMMAGGLFNWGYYASQRWSLEFFVSTEDVGKFYALTQIAYTPVVLTFTLFMSFLVPILYSRVGDLSNQDRVTKTHRMIYRLAGLGIAASIALAALAYVGHEAIFGVLVAERYQSLSVYMPIVILSAGVLQSSIMLSTTLLAQNKTKATLSVSLFACPLIAIMNFVATYWFGLEGLLISLLLGALVHFIWNLKIATFSAY